MLSSDVMISTDNLKEIFGEKIFNRGRKYYEDGRVLVAIKFGDCLYAEVLGTQKYTLRVKLSDITLNECSCPMGHDCKHVVAALLSFLDGNYIDGDVIFLKMKSMDKQEIIDLLEEMARRDLKVEVPHCFRNHIC